MRFLSYCSRYYAPTSNTTCNLKKTAKAVHTIPNLPLPTKLECSYLGYDKKLKFAIFMQICIPIVPNINHNSKLPNRRFFCSHLAWTRYTEQIKIQPSKIFIKHNNAIYIKIQKTIFKSKSTSRHIFYRGNDFYFNFFISHY